MRLIERWRKKIAYHQEQAAKWQTVVSLVETDLEPEMTRTRHRKINGALAQLDAPARQLDEIAEPPTQKKRLKKRLKKRGKVPQRSAIKLTDLALQVLATAGMPLTIADIYRRVDKRREHPTTYNAIGQTMNTLKKDGKVKAGTARKGVYALPEHADMIQQIEAVTPQPGAAARHRIIRRGL